jgi:hypothetical protein
MNMNMYYKNNIYYCATMLNYQTSAIGSQYLLAGPVGWETLKRGGGFYQKECNV